MGILKKKLDGGLNIFLKTILILLFFLFTKIVNSSTILDYQTEEFIKKINNLILSVNEYEKEINFKIILDKNPNAFVNQNNLMIISSGLIEKSPSYISFLAVLAHEIGHIEKMHIIKRKSSINNLQNINLLTNLSVLSGSLISNNTEIMSAIALNQLGISNFYLDFSKDQEREADHYSIETLKKLKLPYEPLIELLDILENLAENRGFNSEFQKFSTHPLYSERTNFVNNNKISNTLVNNELENEFQFIRSKFIGYSIENLNNINNSKKNFYSLYSEAIYYSRKGQFKESLSKINNLIKKHNKNPYLLETKADILMSFGYKKEAIKFYEKVLELKPHNQYVKFLIFINLNNNDLNKNKKRIYFEKYKKLLFIFSTNQLLYLKYHQLSKDIGNKEWDIFFKLYFNKDNIKNSIYKNELNLLYNEVDDDSLKKLIKLKLKAINI